MARDVLSNVDQNYNWFKANLDKLLANYRNKFVVVKNESFVEAYDNFQDALSDMLAKGEKPGTFIIQLCSDNPVKTTATFHTYIRIENCA